MEDGARDEVSCPGEEIDAHIDHPARALLEIFEKLGRMALDVGLHFSDSASRKEGVYGGFADAVKLVRASTYCWIFESV